MRIITFITFIADIQKILEHTGVEPEAPSITLARGPLLSNDASAQQSRKVVDAGLDSDMDNQSPLDNSKEQHTNC